MKSWMTMSPPWCRQRWKGPPAMFRHQVPLVVQPEQKAVIEAVARIRAAMRTASHVSGCRSGIPVSKTVAKRTAPSSPRRAIRLMV